VFQDFVANNRKRTLCTLMSSMVAFRMHCGVAATAARHRLFQKKIYHSVFNDEIFLPIQLLFD
jgi:hypothetical protein